MDFEGIKEVQFFVSLGYVMVISSIITMILTQVVKVILKKKNIINDQTDTIKKDMILSKIGRIIALIVYSILFLLNEYYLKHQIIFDGTLLMGLVSGSALTLSVAKGLYTKIIQANRKKDVFKKLQDAQEQLEILTKKLNQSSETLETNTKIILTRKD